MKVTYLMANEDRTWGTLDVDVPDHIGDNHSALVRWADDNLGRQAQYRNVEAWAVLGVEETGEPKRRYRVKFQETCTYIVEFNHAGEIDEEETGWFEALDNSRPDWITDNATQVTVDERDLIELKEIGVAGAVPNRARDPLAASIDDKGMTIDRLVQTIKWMVEDAGAAKAKLDSGKRHRVDALLNAMIRNGVQMLHKYRHDESMEPDEHVRAEPTPVRGHATPRRRAD